MLKQENARIRSRDRVSAEEGRVCLKWKNLCELNNITKLHNKVKSCVNVSENILVSYYLNY